MCLLSLPFEQQSYTEKRGNFDYKINNNKKVPLGFASCPFFGLLVHVPFAGLLV
jgi:hypothetical protein